jgi:GNAT superfamily N-acetyltransferase
MRPAVDAGSLIFFECDLRRVGTPPAHDEFIVREASLSDLDLLETIDDAARRKRQAAERLAAGERWFVGIHAASNRLANFRWVTARGTIPEIQRDLCIPRHEVYIYDLYTAPEFRRRGVDAVVRPTVYARLRDEGIVRIHAYIAASNHASLRAARTLLAPIGRVYFVSLFGQRPLLFGAQALRAKGVELCASRVRASSARNAANSAGAGGAVSPHRIAIESGHPVESRTSSMRTPE